MNDLTDNLRMLCGSLIDQHVPSEGALFDTIWRAFWKQLPGDTVEQLEAAPDWRFGDPTALAALAATGNQAIDSLYVIATMVGTALSLLRDDAPTRPDTARISKAIQTEAARLQTPDHVRRMLEVHGTGLFAEQFRAVDWRGSSRDATTVHDGTLIVDWYDPQSSVTQGSKLRTRDDVASEFAPRSNRFALYVDEPETLIQAHGNAVQWEDFQGRHLRFLHLVLCALRHGDVIRYQTILEEVLEKPDADPGRIRTLKSELDDRLDGALTGVVVAQRGMEQYRVRKAPFCWIRISGAQSRLTP